MDVLQKPQSPPEPPSEVDELGDRIAVLSARIQAATYELLVLIRDFDERSGWNNGFMSCAHWLNWRTGLALGAAREKVRVARALATLPQLSSAMERGEVSYSKVRAITRVATPENEARLLGFARAGTASHVERLTRAWRQVDRADEARATEERHRRRKLSVWVDDDGMVVIRGRLTPEVGAVVQRALEAANERLFQEARSVPETGEMSEDITPAQRRADALGLIGEGALAGDLDPGSPGDRYQVVVHVDEAALEADGQTAGERSDIDGGQAALEDAGGQRVSAETSRRVACDASKVAMGHGRDGSVLDVGRKTRTIPPAIRRALAARDRGCRFPGCSARHCDAHHVRHWADGGSTHVDNLVLLCRRHHRAVHEGGFSLTIGPDREVSVLRPDGERLDPVPPTPNWSGEPLLPTDGHLAAAGAPIRPSTARPSWGGERLDVAYAIDVLHDGVRGGRTLTDVSAETSGLALLESGPYGQGTGRRQGSAEVFSKTHGQDGADLSPS